MQPSCNNFVKIPIDISFTKKAKMGQHVISYGAISYFVALGDPVPGEMMEQLKPDSVRFVVVMGASHVNPHRDHSIKTALNCYFQAGSCITHFWKPLEGAQPIRYPGAATSNIYKDGNLEHVSSFKAEDGDAYLLNVDAIHSVERQTFAKTRRFIQLSWNKRSFEDVLATCNTIWKL